VNDYWNDPPETDEGPMCPECDDGYGEYLTGNQAVQMFGCDVCGYRWLLPVPGDCGPEDVEWPDIGEDFFCEPSEHAV
jgi:hypothetical protein